MIITEDAQLLIYSALKNLDQLLEVFIAFPDQFENEVEENKVIFTRMKNLQSLNLAIYYGDDVDPEIEESFCNSLISLKPLSKLTLTIYSDNDEVPLPEWLTNLISGFVCLKSLSTLILDFNRCGALTAQAITSLGSSIKQMASLTTLKIYFEAHKTNFDDILFNLCLDLGFASKLESLELNFRRDGGLSDIGLNAIAFALGSLGSSLLRLNLNLLFCKSVTDESLKALSLNLKKLRKLTHLTLILRHASISAKGFEDMIFSIKDSQSLANLTLQATLSGQIDEQFTNNLLRAFGDMSSLKYIELKFAECTETDKRELSRLYICLSSLQNILNALFSFGLHCDTDLEIIENLALCRHGWRISYNTSVIHHL